MVVNRPTDPDGGQDADEVVDLVVVGGGVLGVMTALHARREHPSWSIALLDQQKILQGTTGQSLAIASPGGHSDYIRQLAARSGELYFSHPFSAAVRPRTALLICPTNAETSLHEQLAAPVRRADERALRRLATLLPDLRIDAAETVYAVDDGFAHIDTDALGGLLEPADIRVVEGITVSRCDFTGHHWQLSSTDSSSPARPYRAHRVALAVGPWAGPAVTVEGTAVEPPAGRVKRVAALDIPLPGATAADPLVAFPADNLLLAPHPGRIAVSYRRTQWREDELPDVTSSRWAETARSVPHDAEDLAEGRSALARRSLLLAGRADGGPAFWDSYLPDSAPQVVSPAGSRRLVRLTGGAGSGVRLAPALAEAAVRTLRQLP